MAPGYNTDLQSILRQAMSKLESVSGTDASAAGKSESSSYVNSIWGVAQNAQAAIEGNDEQKAKASINIIEGLLNMVSFAQNQQAKANQEVNNNSQEINKTDQAADKKAQEVQAKVEAIASNIGTNTQNIQGALAKIQELGGEAGGFAELQAQIEAQLDIIEEAKADLNDPEKREKALKKINGAANLINSLITSIPDIQAQIEEQNTIVEQNINEISQQIEESATAISQGIADIQQYIQKGTALGAQAGQISTQGATDVPTGNTEIKAGEAINSNAISSIASGGQGVKLIMDGNQRVSAGQTRIQGGAQNLQKLTTSIGKMGTDISELAEFTNAIGQIGEGAASLAEQYMSAVQPFINAVGTWDVDAIAEANTQLQADVKTLNGKGSVQENNEQVNAQNGQEEFLDTKKLRTAFGI